MPRARFCRTAGRRQTPTASPVLDGALRSAGLVFRAGGRDVDEDVCNDWQRSSDPDIEIIHRAGELLDIQLGRGMNLGRDDDLFGSRVDCPKRQDFFYRRVLPDDRLQLLEQGRTERPPDEEIRERTG